MKKLISIIALAGFLLAIFPFAAMAGAQEVVSLGADLTSAQKQEILNYFGVDENDVEIIKVTNQEMRQYLSGLVPEKQLGTTAYSSAHITLMPKGTGLSVKTNNVAWVTKEMYANVMVTAGIEDADVVVTAPFQVSGASALTGITKAFEKASGKKLDEDAKKTANEELVVTKELGEKIGQEKAAELMREVKEEVVKEKLKDENDIIEAIKRIAAEHGIELTEAQIQQIKDLMKKISRLDLNLNKISKQLENINKSVDDIKKAVEENQGILKKIADSLSGFFNWVKEKIAEIAG
jgi:uncharacterized protein YpuA (DUF1002 family)